MERNIEQLKALREELVKELSSLMNRKASLKTNGTYKFEDIENKKLVPILKSEPTISNLLKDPEKTTDQFASQKSFENALERVRSLKRLIRIEDLKRKNQELKVKVEEMEVYGKNPSLYRFGWIMGGFIAGLALYFVFQTFFTDQTTKVASIPQEKEKIEELQTTETKSILNDLAIQRFVKLMETKNAYQLLVEGIKFNDRVKRGKITVDNLNDEQNELLQLARNILGRTRTDIADMELYTTKGVNLADLAEDSYSLSEMESTIRNFLPTLSSKSVTSTKIIESAETLIEKTHLSIENRLNTSEIKLTDAKSKRESIERTKKHKEKIINEFEDITIIFQSEGVHVAKSIADQAFDTFRSYHKNGQPLSLDEKIDILNKAFEIITVAVGKNREEMAQKKLFIVQNKANIVDILNHIIPMADCFSCSANELMNDKLPSCANVYDKQVWKIRKDLFDSTLIKDEKLFKDKILRSVKSAQFIIRNEQKKQFYHFKKTGKFTTPFEEQNLE